MFRSELIPDSGHAVTGPNIGTLEGSGGENRRRRIFLIVGVIAALVFLVVFGSGFAYWQSLKGTPQYSLALMVDSARRGDQQATARFVDVDAVVDSFLPQITDRAIELYGRGVKPEVIRRVGLIARPILPALKDRVRRVLPEQIKRKSGKFASVPFAAMVVGADRYLEVETAGDTAVVRSKLPEHSFEVTMKRRGSIWTITALRDEELATDIARAIGDEIIEIAADGDPSEPNRLGVRNLTELLKQAEDVLK